MRQESQIPAANAVAYAINSSQVLGIRNSDNKISIAGRYVWFDAEGGLTDNDGGVRASMAVTVALFDVAFAPRLSLTFKKTT